MKSPLNFIGLTSRLLLILSLCFIATASIAQKDSLILKNGNVIVGELKSLDKGVIVVETDYSKSDFTIEWSGIKEIYSGSAFIITLKDGERINGVLKSADGGKKVVITDLDGKQKETTLEDVVYLKGLKSNFWSRAHASVDLGLSITKANNLVQYNVRSTVGYVADKWMTEIFYDDLRTKQDNVPETKRTESGASFTYFLPKDFYAIGALNTLSNTEQALQLRVTAKAGMGKYFIHTNKSYLGVGAGLSLNNETFTNETPHRTSLEAYLGSEVNLFDIGDFSLLSSLYVYPSLTESGRWRTDFKLDTKYDLPLDFYIKFGITVNYDNKPAEIGKETDYVYVFSVGWSL
jgi:small nuclear ribonucleoprotein (snRNP)-like protein